MKLICIPYAGGNSSFFYSWKKEFDFLEVTPIELNGRGEYVKESLNDNLNDAVEDLFIKLKKHSDGNDYAIFGHSMGSLLAYELYYKLVENNLKTPKHIFFSGKKAPHLISSLPPIHNLHLDKFIKKIKEIGGTPDAIFEHSDLLDFFIPILRADFKIVETYKYMEKNIKIGCPVSVIGGLSDQVARPEELIQWTELCANECNIQFFEGGHFFIEEKKKEVIQFLKNTLDIREKMKI